MDLSRTETLILFATRILDLTGSRRGEPGDRIHHMYTHFEENLNHLKLTEDPRGICQHLDRMRRIAFDLCVRRVTQRQYLGMFVSLTWLVDRENCHQPLPEVTERLAELNLLTNKSRLKR